jgi:hypothetical protein
MLAGTTYKWQCLLQNQITETTVQNTIFRFKLKGDTSSFSLHKKWQDTQVGAQTAFHIGSTIRSNLPGHGNREGYVRAMDKWQDSNRKGIKREQSAIVNVGSVSVSGPAKASNFAAGRSHASPKQNSPAPRESGTPGLHVRLSECTRSIFKEEPWKAARAIHLSISISFCRVNTRALYFNYRRRELCRHFTSASRQGS